MIGISFTVIVALLSLIWLAYRFINYKKNKEINIPREILINLFFIYFLIVLNFTFFKLGALYLSFDNHTATNFIPLVETIKMFTNPKLGYLIGLYNIFGNILLFVPLGLGIPLLFKNKNKLLLVTFYGFIVSLSIEILQYLTCVNTTDIDDIIFNALGAIIGFISFNILISLFKNSKLYTFYNNVTVNCDKSLLTLCAKPIIPMFIVSLFASLGILYSNTSSGLLPKQALANEVFSYNNDFNFVQSCDFFNHKLFLYDFGDYLEVRTANKVLNNRWISGEMSQLHFVEENYGYSVMIVDNDKSKGIVIYGRNNDAKIIEITFNGKKYAEPLKTNTYFMVTFPTFEELTENSDLLEIYKSGECKTLGVDFLEEDGNKCSHMKLIK